MINFMKYEIKGTYKYIMGVLALVLILITGLYVYGERAVGGSIGAGIFIALSVMILFGTALVTFFYIVSSFRKELYEDTGYLTFTLPLKGTQIVGAKLMVALLWFLLLGIAILLYNLVMVFSFTPVNLNFADLFEAITNIVSFRNIIMSIIVMVFSGISLLVTVYFSMALSKVTFRNKRIGGLWFVIFLVLSGVLAFIQFRIEAMLPYYFDFETLKVITETVLDQQISFSGSQSGFEAEISGLFPLNIAGTIFSIIATVSLFLGTSYLMEKKIDL